MNNLMNYTYPNISGYKPVFIIKKHGKAPERKIVYKKSGEKVKLFVKFGKSKKRLVYENLAHKLFYSKLKNNSALQIPKPVRLINTSNSWSLVMEYLEIESIKNLSLFKKIDIYIKVLSSLLKINEVKDLKNTGLKIYTPVYLIFTVPYFFAIALIRNGNLLLLSRSLLKMILQFPNWLKLKPIYLCHGDIHQTNIMMSGGKIALIDFGESLISHKYYDLSIAVNTCWRTPAFCRTLLKTLIKNNFIDKRDLYLFNSLAIYNLMQRLTGKISYREKLFYIKRLKFYTNN
jgi:fructosamine-3-kinase